jgi:arylsulfatase A-like enzyme
MNIIMIVLDSLRWDHLGCLGNDWIDTPNIDRFSQEAVIFENAYPEGLFTLPMRTSLFTGNFTLNSRPWGYLTKFDVILPEILDEYDYTSVFITDVYHYFKPAGNFHRGFHSWNFIRGQELDAYISKPHGKDLNDYMKPAMKGTLSHRLLDQYLRNTAHFETEEDYFSARVFNEAINWVETNHQHHKQFFMMIDSFDPHEPWDPPEPFDTKYTDPKYKGPKLIAPKYGPVDWMTKEELEYVRGLYAGEVSFVDKRVGLFLDKLSELGLMEESIIVLLSDHGHPHGDHGTIMKTPQNLYSELIRIPLMIRFPDKQYSGERIKAIVQVVDIAPTLLDMIGGKNETITMHGKSLMPVIQGEKARIREYAHVGIFGNVDRCIRDEEWSYIHRPQGVDNELYNLVDDPRETKNMIHEYTEKAEELSSQLLKAFRLSGPKPNSYMMKYDLEDSPPRFEPIIAKT